jgi:integrase
MICIRCHKDVPDAPYCCLCGSSQQSAPRRVKSRGNGQGSVYRLPNGKYAAVKTVGYYLDDDGKRHRKTVSKQFTRRRDAVNAVPLLGIGATAKKAERKPSTTFKQLYDLWLPTHTAGRDTLNCYKAAIKYFSPLYHERVTDIDIDDLQECLDDCPKGRSTRRNMKTVCGLVYKYGIPRGYLPDKLNLADYLKVSGDDGAGGTSLPDAYLDKIAQAVGKVPGADYVYAQCYLGFRPSEFLALDARDYDRKEKVLHGGAKTEAGKNRAVTVSPKIQGIVDALTRSKATGAIFCGSDGTQMDISAYRELFYSLLDALGLENPTYELDGKQRHTYTPHSCRHTFATLMKRVKASSKDKLELIGHSSEEMLHYYQDVNYDDLRKITDCL